MSRRSKRVAGLVAFFLCAAMTSAARAQSGDTDAAQLKKVVALQQAQIQALTTKLATLTATVNGVISGKKWIGDNTGLVGPKGDRGDRGIQGTQGVQGIPGPSGNPSNTLEFHSRSGLPFRFYMHKNGTNGGSMWVFEESGKFFRWDCGNFADFHSCQGHQIGP